MNRTDVIRAFGAVRGDAAVVCCPGLANYQIAEHADYVLTLFAMDMAYVSSTALGMALAWPDRRVVAVEGDGSMLMGLTSLVTIARCAPPNLVTIVFDNGVYLTTGSGTATTATVTGTDIEAVGRAAGIPRTATVETIEAARDAVGRSMREPGPWLIVAKVDRSDRDGTDGFHPLPTDVFESAQRFRSAAVDQRSGGRPPGRVMKY
jgi:thiamine pyrophosphate-dependent acetolactate synthase large subunit-like protein